MAAVFRVGFCRLLAAGRAPETSLTRRISGKTLRMGKSLSEGRPAPWDYENKSFNMLHRLFDRTTARFHENTKVIVVDGPLASGKATLAKQLAEDLDMLYFPQANYDMICIDDYGFDLRSLNPKLPKSCQVFDLKDVCKNPKDSRSAIYQYNTYITRYSQYIDALAHVLSTGQGVVMNRSVYSDFVFTETMYNQGYFSKNVRRFYNDVKQNSIYELMRPHLVIYLDVPVETVRKNIQDRGISYEVNSKLFTNEFLETMERIYKQQFLKSISEHSELLVYDWSNGGDFEVVVEDIERIDFDRFEKGDKKMSDWRLLEEEDWHVARNMYADDKQTLMCYVQVPNFDADEVVIDGNDYQLYENVLEEIPSKRYAVGYNTEMGDSSNLFKWRDQKRRFTLPRVERKSE